MEDELDPRAKKEGICGVTIERDDGNAWICIKDVHDTSYISKKRGMILSNNPSVHRHYFVAKYPYRKKDV